MSFDADQPTKRSARRLGVTVALLGAGVAAGAIGATTIGANAATTTGSGSTTGTTSTSSTAPGAPDRQFDPGGSTPVRSDEKSVSAATAATLKAAALKAVPGGTVIRVETDAGDAAYEVHMKKADGSLVTVKFNKDLSLKGVEDGMGEGDPAPAGAPGPPH
jgi:hypothetical protein